MSLPKGQEVESSSSSSSSSSESSQLCRQFTLSEIQQAIRNFDETLVIGRGGFGKVYKGTVTNGSSTLTVAIKRLDSSSNQGASEFWAEVNMLSGLRHCHLVSLIGYCNDGREMILVYEFMSRGTLEDHLHRPQTSLSWVQRLAICLGAARGLDYLHTGTGIKHGVVHRDVKSSNILLHDSWAAKISDFGLSRICPKTQQVTYVDTGIKGTFGYLDPDYFYTGKLTRKSDVYSFGVVLFEVLCGKRAVDRSIDEEQWGLAIWAQNSIKVGRLIDIVDTNIRGSISSKCLKVFAQLAKRCLHKHPKQRPTMAEVVVGLDSILALQEKANNTLQPAGIQFFGKKAPTVMFPSNDENSGGENQTLHRFDFVTINVATENFSVANRISQPEMDDSLYKGRLQNGQGITVARIPFSTRYDSFMDERSILGKLEHENLARLLGYCIEETYLFFVYDFALNATRDRIIFDPGCTTLNGDIRYKILLGVARALLYLHRDAPIQIIHCNLKPGNILLDENLNPVLFGFSHTRYVDIDRTTFLPVNSDPWNYKAPEYMYYASVSTKADVYSFGALVLETVSRKFSALKCAEGNWLEGALSPVTRFLEIGLLCVQKNVEDRPTIEEVVSMMLGSLSLNLPLSKIRARMTEEYSNSTSAHVNDYDTVAVEEFMSELVPR